jgi:TetR/AcrR family transcriptional repressor of bet genes
LANFHFRSKDTLLAETLKHLAQGHRDMWMRDLQRHDLAPADKLRSVITAQFHASICSRKELAVWIAFFGEVAHRKTYRAITSQIDIERQEICSELLEDINAEGAYGDVDAESIALALEGMFDGLWLNILTYPAKFTRKSAADQVLNYLRKLFPKKFTT